MAGFAPSAEAVTLLNFTVTIPNNWLDVQEIAFTF